jgi:Flp pilus assembly protein TadG
MMFQKLKHYSEALARKLAVSQSGAAVVEFALLGPLFLMLLFGMFQVGIYLQNFNAVQSLASDSARYVMVEYQKSNELTDEQIRSVILGQATNSPYLLDTNRLNITVDSTGASRIAGATEIDVEVRYELSEFIPGVELPLSVIEYSRSVWVVIE